MNDDRTKAEALRIAYDCLVSSMKDFAVQEIGIVAAEILNAMNRGTKEK